MLIASLFIIKPKLETIQMSINGRINKQIMIYSYNDYFRTTFFFLMKYLIHSNKDESQKNMLSQGSQTEKNTYSYDSICVKFKNIQN